MEFLELFYRTGKREPGWSRPGESGFLFAESRDSGWHLPTVSAPPGVFIEPCDDGEDVADLTEDEYGGPLREAARGCRWGGVGFEAGRAFFRVSARAAVGDAAVLTDTARWILAAWGPPPAHLAGWFTSTVKPWAVEFPAPGGGNTFLRRRFWYPRTHPVPHLSPARGAA